MEQNELEYTEREDFKTTKELHKIQKEMSTLL